MTHVDTPQSICRFGLARCDITPPVGIYHRMWGAALHDRASGVHRPLFATATAFAAAEHLELGPDRLLVAMDLCFLWPGEIERLVRCAATAAGIEREGVTLAFSHTHAAGLLGRDRVDLPGGELIPPYFDQLADRVATIAAAAAAAVEPVTITYATGRCYMGAHRDFRDPESGEFVCGFNPHGEADPHVLVARVTNKDDRLLATLVNYACHPTTLAWQNTLISPDYPGAMRELVEDHTGAPCVFLQGAAGDVGPRDGYTGDVAVADRNGRQLGHAVLAAFESMPPPRTRMEYTGAVVSGAMLGTWEHRPLDAAALAPLRTFRNRLLQVELPYRDELGDAAQLRTDCEQWQRQEDHARAVGDLARALDCRAHGERTRRLLARIESLPAGDVYRLPVAIWQSGDAIWIAVEGEPYVWLQRELRRRFPGRAMVVIGVGGGAQTSYLPTRDTYGRGIYQESIAVLAPGCLETLCDEIAAQIDRWMPDRE